MLGEAAELALMLSRELAVQARQCETPAESAVLVEAFNKTLRGMRLCLALDHKLTRDAARDDREVAREAKAAAAETALRDSRIMRAAEAAHVSMTDPSPAEIQKRRVCRAMNRLLWAEAEGDQEDYEVLLEDLDARLDEAEDAPGFADLPIERVVRKLKADMRLAGELVITTAASLTPANTPAPPLADTG
jgi:hypothetical protein